MILHNDTKLLGQAIRATSNYLNIVPNYIEKDYWITRTLKLLSESVYSDTVVFKGGTSLSKGYGLIDRFSEDVDIAIINNNGLSGNQIKTRIRDVEKAMTIGLSEMNSELSSKGSRFRKSVFEYHSCDTLLAKGKLIVEINSFTNPFPYEKLAIKSLITEYLEKNGQTDIIAEYELMPFKINVLNKNQTLLEKLVSLIRFSYGENPITSISSKIRHFYDLYYLLQDKECIDFVNSGEFKLKFDSILKHDKDVFDQPKDWAMKNLSESPLIHGFDKLWLALKDTYTTELSALSFTEIPAEKLVSEQVNELFQKLED